MSKDALVIDSSAIIAELKNEPGAETVREIMAKPPSGGFFMHALNVCEMAYHLIKSGIPEDIAYEIAMPGGVVIIDDVRPTLWKRAAALRGCS